MRVTSNFYRTSGASINEELYSVFRSPLLGQFFQDFVFQKKISKVRKWWAINGKIWNKTQTWSSDKFYDSGGNRDWMHYVNFEYR